MVNDISPVSSYLLYAGFGISVVWSVVGWLFWLLPEHQGNSLGPSTVTIIFIIIALILFLGFSFLRRRSFSPAPAIALVTAIVSLVLQEFTFTYYNIGTDANFSKALSRLDALYVALGNMTTAGTGNIYPISEEARAWVSGQYFADIIVFTALVSALLYRLSKSN